MAETLAQIGYLTLFKLGDGASPPAFATIKEIKEISGFGFTSAQLEATHMESPNRYKEFVSGLKEGDVFTARMNFTSENATIMKAWADAGLRSDFELQFPGDLPTYELSATPDSWHIEGISPDGILEAVVGMKISGDIATAA